MSENSTEKVSLPHHEQQELCTTRLPYRQGRKLTAVKVYTINNESNHLLVFGVPSLNLRQEAKTLFARFGKLLQFNLTTDHPAEVFTETYHAKFEKIQSARIAKRMLDTKNFYGGSLHVCYAPELESLDETRQKILKRKQDVLFRLRNLEVEAKTESNKPKKNEGAQIIELIAEDVNENNKRTMNMGEVNTILVGNNKRKRKEIEPTPIVNEIDFDDDNISGNKNYISENSDISSRNNDLVSKQIVNNPGSSRNSDLVSKKSVNNPEIEDKTNINELAIRHSSEEIDIVDFTSADKEIVSNINEALNYNKFGNEVIRKVPQKPVNRIKFNFTNK